MIILKSEFHLHRVIFWYDELGESRELFDEVDIPRVEKVVGRAKCFCS